MLWLGTKNITAKVVIFLRLDKKAKLDVKSAKIYDGASIKKLIHNNCPFFTIIL